MCCIQKKTCHFFTILMTAILDFLRWPPYKSLFLSISQTLGDIRSKSWCARLCFQGQGIQQCHLEKQQMAALLHFSRWPLHKNLFLSVSQLVHEIQSKSWYWSICFHGQIIQLQLLEKQQMAAIMNFQNCYHVKTQFYLIFLLLCHLRLQCWCLIHIHGQWKNILTIYESIAWTSRWRYATD